MRNAAGTFCSAGGFTPRRAIVLRDAAYFQADQQCCTRPTRNGPVTTGRAMLTRRPMRAALLSLLYAVSGGFSLLDAGWPQGPQSPTTLGWVTGALSLGVAAVVWWRGARLTDREVHGALILAAVLVALLASRFATAVGIVALGPVIITLCLYSGWFLPLPAARVRAAVTLLLASAGPVLATPSG